MRKKKVKQKMAAMLCMTLAVSSIAAPSATVSAAGVNETQSITLNVDSQESMYVGMSEKIKVKSVQPKNGSKKVTYESSDPEIVKVSSSGTMKAMMEGEAVITVTSAANKDVSEEVEVNVKNLVKNKTYNKMVIPLDKKNKTRKLQRASKVKASYLKITTNKRSVATVSNAGVVTGKKAGTAKITIKGKKSIVKGAKQIITVYVAKKSVETVTLDKTSTTLKPGEPMKLTTTVTPKNAANVVVFTSSDEDVATVDQKGNVTAVKEGTAEITATTVDGSKEAVCVVTVSKTAADKTSEATTEKAGSEATTEAKTEGTTEEKPGTTTEDKTEENAGTATEEKTEATTGENTGVTTETRTEATTGEKPGSTTENKTEATTEEATKGTTEDKTETTTETSTEAVTTESATEATTQTTTESATEVTTEITTEATTAVTTENTTEITTETTTEATTETTTQATTEVSTEATTETTTEQEPEKAEGPIEPVIIPVPETKTSFATVAEMKAADLKEGDIVKTQGYWEAGDNGAAAYEIMTYEKWYSELPKDILYITSGNKLIQTPVDECGNHTLENGLVAKLYGNSYTPEQWGAKEGANLMPFIHMFAQVKTGRIDFAENKTYELELVKQDNPYRTYMCGALLGGQFFYKPIMGNVHDLVMDGHNCTITMPDDSFGDSGMGMLNFAQDIVNMEIMNFNFDGKGHTMFWSNKSTNHLLFYAPGALYANGVGTDHWRYDPTVKPDVPNESFTKTKIENWQIHDNTFNDAGTMRSTKGDYGGDCILAINPDAVNGFYVNNNEFYNWGRWVLAIDLGGYGERLYNISFNDNKCIGANGYDEVNEDGTFKFLNKAPQMVGSEDTWRWRALGLIDFECKKCFTNVEMKNNYINGSGGWAINGNSKVSENIQIENNYWKHVGGGYSYGFEFYSGFAKDLVVRNNQLIGVGFKAGIFTHNLTFENNVFTGGVRTFGLAGDIIFKGNRKLDPDVIACLWNNAANQFFDDEYLSYDKVKDIGVNIVFKDNDAFFRGIFTDMKDIDRFSYMNFDVDTDDTEIWQVGITAFGTNLKINPNAFTSKPQDMYIHGAEITQPFSTKNGLGSIVKVKAGQTVATNMQTYGVVGGYFIKNMTGIENFTQYNGCNWGAYAARNNYSNVKLVCTQDGYIPGCCEYGFRYQGTHISYVLNNNLTLQDHAYVYTDDNLYYTEAGGKLTETPTHTEGTVTYGDVELTYIGKVAKVKVVGEQ